MNDNTLEILNASSTTSLGIESNFNISGDFDIQVDVSRIADSYTGSYGMNLEIHSTTDGSYWSDWAYITVCYWSGGEVGTNVSNRWVW